jgi:hypothetical protein
MCDKKRCDERCALNLKCGHRCRGICGEKCPPCIECDARKPQDQQLQCAISLMSSLELLQGNGTIYKLECGHVFDTESLDEYMFREPDGDQKIAYKQCPSCKQPIFISNRYANVIKQAIHRVEELKKHILRIKEQRSIQRREIMEIVNAREGTSAGHWFMCPNGHFYVIGECGGAMQTSICPDCREKVGGSSHTLLNTNRPADNNTNPAWPTVLDRPQL